jgi:lambda repressor-like predicted transcriptional regulator
MRMGERSTLLSQLNQAFIKNKRIIAKFVGGETMQVMSDLPWRAA